MSMQTNLPLIEHVSASDFERTLRRLDEVISAAGMTIFARIDHAAAARAVGLQMPPTVVLLFGNPKGGTPVMLAAPRAALDLPLRILVREGPDGTVVLAFHPIGHVLRDAGVSAEAAGRLQSAQELLLKAFAG